MKKYLGKAGVILALVLPCLLYSQETREYRDRYFVRGTTNGEIVCYDLISNRVHTAHTGKRESVYIIYLPTPGGGMVYAKDMGGMREVNLYWFALPDLRLIRKITLNSLFPNHDEGDFLPGTPVSAIVRNPHPCLIFRAIPDANHYYGGDEYYEEVMGKGMEWNGLEVKHFIWDPMRGSDLREISYRQFKTMPRINLFITEERRRYGLPRVRWGTWGYTSGEKSKHEKLLRKVRELNESYTGPLFYNSDLTIEEPVPAE